MKRSDKWMILILAAAMMLASAAALAVTLEPERTDIGPLAGATVHATVAEYDENEKVFTVILYGNDRYEREKAEALTAGDILLAGGELHRMTGKEPLGDDTVYLFEGGEEIMFVPAEDGSVLAESTDDDRQFMHVCGILKLPAAENIRLEDASDPDREEAVVTAGLADILKVKADLEETSNGLNYYATVITLNGDLEISVINRMFDVAQ